MKPTLYTVSDNSFNTRGFPWIDRIVKGMEYHDNPCPECGGGPGMKMLGNLDVELDPKKGRKWPDVLGCGAATLLIVSERVLNDWRADKVGDMPVGGEIVFLSPLPKRLEGTKPPSYFWLDSQKLIGAQMDEEASGFVGFRQCSTCGRRTWDIGATYDRQHSQPWGGYVLSDWNGANLFTTLSHGFYFCTENVVKCAQRHRHTNFRFVPLEEGDAAESPGLKYLSPTSPDW